MEKKILIVCFSQFDWDRTLFQRPQQVMLRLSKKHKILWIRPLSFRFLFKKKGPFGYEKNMRVNSNLQVFNPIMLPTLHAHLPFVGYINSFLLRFLIKRKITKLQKAQNIFILSWYYYPLYEELAGKIGDQRIIYECMDEFAAFRDALSGMEKKDLRLLSKADIVFVGGMRMYRRKKKFNSNIHFFPTGVEYDHFSSASDENTKIPDDVRDLSHPILGYWGAVDERLDYRLLAYVAEKRPTWSIVLLGPLTKIKPKEVAFCLDLPNVHWLGPKKYGQLPHYGKAFDICLLPFVSTKEAENLNPTKTLEYLAMGTPCVSTALDDIKELYAEVVSIAPNSEEFLKAAENVLAHDSPEKREARKKFAQGKSWEAMVDGMEKIVLESCNLGKLS
jgi:glycosyltransferase involved in cell wall biosynthesis